MKRTSKLLLTTLVLVGTSTLATDAWTKPCASTAACEEEALAAAKAKKYKLARASATRACEGKSAVSCYLLGVMSWQGLGVKRDPVRTAVLFKKACGLKHADGCYNLGVLYRDGIGLKKDADKAVGVSLQACKLGYNNGCLNAGVMLLKGQGVKKDVKRAAGIFKIGCDRGHKSSCKGAGLAKQALSGGAGGGGGVSKPNVTVGSMTANGFTIKDMRCRVSGAGFLASALVVGSLGKSKKLRRCAKKGTPRVVWTYTGGKAKVTSVSGASGKVKKCIRREMKKVRAGSMTGTCEGLFVLGK